MLYKKYIFNDTAVYYTVTEYGVGLSLYPADVTIADIDALRPDSMVQVSLRGDNDMVDYSQGLSMRNRTSVLLKIREQVSDGAGVVTYLSDGKGNEYEHTLRYDAATGVFAVHTEYFNRTKKAQVLESLQSFSVSGIGNITRQDMRDVGLKLVRMTSAWSRECRLKEDEFWELGMDMSWARHGVRCERFGQTGSMPNRSWYPFAAIAEETSGFILAVMMEASYSWQMELYRLGETCALSGGLADRNFGHWYKKIRQGESFRTQDAYIRVRYGNVNDVCNDFVHFQDARLRVPACEEEMPVLFNEYCTTWGEPSDKNIREILDSLDGMGFGYFVIDAGWYKPDNRGWGNAPGDWNENVGLFPAGIAETVRAIRGRGLKAGIWFELEVAGKDSAAYRKKEWFLKRDGAVLTVKNRRFFDLRDRAVKEYLQSKVCDFLRDNGFSYIKIDYNENYGIGCDGAESVGEGGREVAAESIAFLSELKESVPGIVIENCASGGSRIEPRRMREVSMCSFSDAHECKEIPLVAANVSRVVPARQNQIWAVIRKEDTVDRIVWSMTAAMFGRICVSGDVHKIDAAQKAKVREGIAFYEAVKDVIRDGDITETRCDVKYFRDPKGCQIYKKVSRDKSRMLILAHFFERPYSVSETDVSGYKLAAAYTSLDFETGGGRLRFQPVGEYLAGAFVFEKI